MTEGASAQVSVLEQLMPGEDAAARRRQALAGYAAMVGAIVLARAVDDEALSLEIDKALAGDFGGGSAVRAHDGCGGGWYPVQHAGLAEDEGAGTNRHHSFHVCPVS
jgi:hypothetical protein